MNTDIFEKATFNESHMTTSQDANSTVSDSSDELLLGDDFQKQLNAIFNQFFGAASGNVASKPSPSDESA